MHVLSRLLWAPVQQPEWGREESAREYLKEETKKLENCDKTE